jgi:hypothetical protein
VPTLHIYILTTGVAEVLTDAITKLDDISVFSPSWHVEGLLRDDYDSKECTVLAVHDLVKKAILPIDTYILAALIIKNLGETFYDGWSKAVYEESFNEDCSKEVIIVAAMVSLSALQADLR